MSELDAAVDELIAALTKFKSSLEELPEPAEPNGVPKTAVKTPSAPSKKVQKPTKVVDEQEIDLETGEILKSKKLPVGFRHTDDCPKGEKLCKISDREAQLSQIRYRKTLCGECFKDHS